MKRKKLLFKSIVLIVCLFLLPCVVKANDSSISNWKLFCDETELTEANLNTNCYLIAQITDATNGGNKISAVLTRVTAEKAEIVSAHPAFNTTQVETTLASAKFNNNLHGSNAYCTDANCYDFTSSSGIVSNSNDSKIISHGFTGYTPIGYWNIKLLADQITSDTECAKICVYADMMLQGSESTVGNMPTNTANGACIELNLAKGGKKICYCDPTSNVCYGLNGSEVTKEQFTAECACRVENGKFYDQDGKEVTKDVYEAKCNKKVCYESDGKYYGKDGVEVTKEQFEKDCLPKTGNFASYAVLAAGALIALSAITVAKKHNKFYRV